MNLSLNDLENEVISVASWDIYNIKFPYELTPLHFRIVAHIIGAGCNSGGSACWIQKDAAPLLKLQKTIFPNNHKKYKSQTCEKCTINNFYPKLVCAALNLETDDVKTAKFIDRCLLLDKDFQVQVLAALIEDEGCIRSKNCSLHIAMTDKNIVLSMASLMDSLGYERGRVTAKIGTGYNNKIKLSLLYHLDLYVLGVNKFYMDLMDVAQKYGKEALLWKKQKELENYVKLNNGWRAIAKKRNGQVIPFLLDNYNKEIISWMQIKNLLKLSHRDTGHIIRRMIYEGLISKSRRGIYHINYSKTQVY